MERRLSTALRLGSNAAFEVPRHMKFQGLIVG
jgi:hypothetical protein